MDKAYKLQTLYNEMIKYYEERGSLVLKVLPFIGFYINAKGRITAYKEAKTGLYEKTTEIGGFIYRLFQEDKIDLDKFDKVNKECSWKIIPPDKDDKYYLIKTTHLELLMKVSENPLELLYNILK